MIKEHRRKKSISLLSILLACACLFPGCSSEDGPKAYTSEDLKKEIITRTAPQIEKAEAVDPTAGDFTVSKAISDDMIIQRDDYINVWGFAEESENGKTICAEFMGLKGSATIEDGKWLITLDGTLPACSDLGNTLRVYSATHEEKFEDILVGDVYLIVGQSNAASTVSESLEDWASDDNYNKDFSDEDISKEDNIRIIQNLPNDPSVSDATVNLAEDVMHQRGWRKPSKRIVYDTSAIGYFFAKQLMNRTNSEIPIGIVECSWAGAVMAAFMSAEVAEACKVDEYTKAKGYMADSILGKQASRVIYNQKINPFVNFSFSGMIWYQGESDASGDLPDVYANNFKMLVEDYRNKIDQNFHDSPVFVIELPTEYSKPDNYHGEWTTIDVGEVRSKMGIIPSICTNVHLVASSDVWTGENFSNNLHPYCKWPMATRVVDMVMPMLYSEYSPAEFESVSGPVYAAHVADDKKTKVDVFFTNTSSGLKTQDGKAPRGFEVLCGGEWTKPENVSISTDCCITITHFEKIQSVRYFGITSDVFPNQINVCNSNNVPMCAFSIDII